MLNRFGPRSSACCIACAASTRSREMSWNEYALAALLFNVLGLLVVYALQRLQASLPLNPQDLGAVSPDSSFNTAASFATQHQLAGLRRRDDDELSDPDARR